MRNFRKFKPIFWTILGYGTLGSVLIIADQIHKIFKKIDKATSSDVMSIDKIQPTYIYIEDPFLQEEIEAGVTMSTERLKLTRLHKWVYDKIEGSFIFRNWYLYKKNLPWRFLQLAQDDNQSYRIRAVRALAQMKNLTDSDYQQLAQSCDMRTAVGLARSTDNVKFLLDPPHFKSKPDRKVIISKLHSFFRAIVPNSDHPCLQYFVNKVITDVMDADSKVFDEDFRFSLSTTNFIPMCLDALLHHSWTDANARQIIELGGLPLLVEVYKYINEDESLDALISLSKLMSNISVCTEYLQNFYASGWIKLLWILSQHKDIRVSAPANKALINFDKDDPQQEGLKYFRGVFPLHPTKRTLATPKVDVIFIHGLLGEVFITWRQRDSGQSPHKSPLELLAIIGKLFDLKIINHLAFAHHLLAPKKVPSFPIPESGLTACDDEKERLASYQKKTLDHDFLVNVTNLNNWEKIINTYEFVLSDLPVDSNVDCQGPFYMNPKDYCKPDTIFSKCWPKDWLARDCPDIRLIGVSYETNISKWTPLCPISPSSGRLKERSELLIKVLTQAGVGKRPIVWMGHSMGGLLIKNVLCMARDSKDPAIKRLLEQTRGIVFYSTPHKGSHLAALNATSQMIVWPSDEVQELRENSPGLLELHKKFLDITKENPIEVMTFAERESTYITSLKFEITFVDTNSSNADVGESYGIPLDHLHICKPAGRQSFLYQKVKKFIQEIIKEEDKKKNLKDSPHSHK